MLVPADEYAGNTVQYHAEDVEREITRRQAVKRDGAAAPDHADRLFKGLFAHRGHQRAARASAGQSPYRRGGIIVRPCVDRLHRTEPAGEVEFGVVDVDGDHLHPHGHRILYRHMAETADAGDDDRIAGPGIGHLQALVDRHARAQHRRDFVEADIVRQVADIIGVGQHVVGEPAIDRIAGVQLAFAQRLPSTEAVRAVTASGVEPRHADPVAFLHVGHALAHSGDKAHAFVARDKGRLGLYRPVAFCGVEVGVTHTGGLNGNLDHAGLDLGNRNFLDPQWLAKGAHDGGFHGLAHDISPVVLSFEGRAAGETPRRRARAVRLRRSRASSGCS